MNGRKTLVEEGTQFKGSLTSDCPIEVKGRIEGDLTAPALSVSTSGAVHGKVKVGEMKSQGELAGEFDADLVQLSGSVKDNTIIRAKSLEVKLAPPNGKMQVVFGECELEVGSEQPAKEPTKEKDKEKTPSARPPAAEAAPPTETNGSSSVRPPPV
ncbi:MAG: polymer-forming cytoskeletal protein [Polyangiaceae bacterium]|jgi:cytoskeletal protein CcmA (bactofilin family)